MGGYKNSITDIDDKVGINNSNPLSLLHISSGTSGDATLIIESDTDNNNENDNPQLQFKQDGGATVVKVGITGEADTIFTNSLANAAYFGNDELAALQLYTDSTARLTIQPNGHVLIGTTSTIDFSKFSVDAGTSANCIGLELDAPSGYTAISLNRTASDGSAISFKRSGTGVGSISVTSTATAYNTSSDYRLKENVVPMEGALDRVDALKPSRFNFIADPEKTVDGFLAHEVAEVVPEAISGEKDAVDEEGNPIYQGIDQSKLVPLLVGAIQELRAEIEALKQNSVS